MICGADDLLEPGVAASVVASTTDPPIAVSDYERRVWGTLTEPSLPDVVARRALLSIPDAVAALIRLELRGLVRSTGGRYERTLSGGQART